MVEILKRRHSRAPTDDLVFRKHRIQFDSVGDSHRSIHLAGTPPPTTARSVAAFAHPAQLPLPRAGIPGAGCRITRSTACFCAFRGLWGHHRRDTCVAFAGNAAQWGWRCRRMDLQLLGFGRYPQRFLPGQSRRIIGGAVGSCILPPDFGGAAADDYARTGLPNSCATSTCTGNRRTPIESGAGTFRNLTAALGPHCISPRDGRYVPPATWGGP